jgi:thiol-disulfide isomerase/thioredoxin
LTNKAGGDAKFEFEPLTLIARFAAGRIPTDGKIQLHDLAGAPRKFVLQVGEDGSLPGDVPEGFLEISFPDSDVRTNAFTLDLARIIPLGAKVPEFSVRAISSGSLVTQSNFAGKFLIVKFWATTCPPCIPQMDEHDQLLGRHKGEWKDKVAGLAVSLDDDLLKLREHIQSRGWTNFYHTWTGQNGSGFDSEIAKAFGVRALPASYIIHPSGVLLWAGHLDQAEARMRYLLENVRTTEDITNYIAMVRAARR